MMMTNHCLLMQSPTVESTQTLHLLSLHTGKDISFKIDTGSQVNVIPATVYEKMREAPPLRPSSSKIFSYSGQRLPVTGDITMECQYKECSYTGVFHVVDTPPASQPILGLPACLQLKVIQLVLSVDSDCTLSQNDSLLTKNTVIEEYKHLYSGLGDLEGEITIHLKENATPVVHPPRRVPHAIKHRLKEELDKMENTGVIDKVSTPTDWANSLVVVEKENGKLRICLDPRDLNAAIKRPHYPMPILEDALAKLTSAKYFSKLDASSGYWQLKLDDKSSYLTTFNTPFGRYLFRRLPFGFISAQDEFQRKMDEVFEGLPGVTLLVDDVLISGRTRQEHDRNLQAALERSSTKNLKLNPDKLVVGATEVQYFGHIISSEGLKPDPAKVKAVQDMSPPINKKELQNILGMINYLAKFAPQLSETTKPMRDLLKENVDFIWDHKQDEALKKAKELILSQHVLAYFDPSEPITLQVDASQHGVGGALFQEGKPIAFASKSLSKAEEKYSQVEKELYAILFGCKRFHQYVYGHKIMVQTDHKPLESIMKKPLGLAPPSLQRMLLQLQRYDLKVHHVPGKNIPVADVLSRKFMPAENS